MKLLIITSKESDLSLTLQSCGAEVTVREQKELLDTDISVYDRFCVLGGTEDTDICIDARLREKLENELLKGKRLFCEYIPSIQYIYSAHPQQISHHRLVCVEPSAEGLNIGDVLDDHYNDYLMPYCMMPGALPILVYHDYICAHSHTEKDRDTLLKNCKWAMWQCGDNLLMTAFRLCNYVKARFAPAVKWQKLIDYISVWLTDAKPSYIPEPVCKFTEYDPGRFGEQLEDTVRRGFGWLERYLIDEGRGGIKEGLSHNIKPSGEQLYANYIRTDCSGEAGGAFKFRAQIKDCINCRYYAENLEDFIFGPMQIKSGVFKGMLRWSEAAWGVCYQDDAARAILPTLLGCYLSGDRRHINEAGDALRFMADTTAQNGLRTWRTDNIALDKESLKSLKDATAGSASAHYNAYYCAALILGYLCGLGDDYLEIGRKGLENLLSIYPETRREQSETQEMCRLIFPLACLYDATKEKRHYDMLHRVTSDLQRIKHSFGGYAEWDTGYKASCARNENGECSLLAENGDPVADLLYSVNWLGLGFAYAFKATGEQYFYELWHSIAEFYIKTQIHSVNKQLDGAWSRAFDMDAREINGVPHDEGWAACCVESGWTVGEILMGLQVMDLI